MEHLCQETAGSLSRWNPLQRDSSARRFTGKLSGIVIAGPAILTANDLALSYGYQRLLESVTLSVAPGEKVGLVGRNGSGKTSLLRILAGHQGADVGEIIRRRGLRIGYLPQEFELDPNLTVRENIEAGAAA